MRRGFALIYVLLLVALISITIVAVTTSTLSDMRQAKRVDNTTEIYQLAQSGLEDAFIRVQAGNGCVPDTLNVSLPPDGSYRILDCEEDHVTVRAIRTDASGNEVGRMSLRYDINTKQVTFVGN